MSAFDIELARAFLNLKSPLTFSVLPARRMHRRSRGRLWQRAEVLLHLPMEPKESNGEGPGSGALLANMGEEEFVKTLNGHLSRIRALRSEQSHGLPAHRERRQDGLLFRELKKRHLFLWTAERLL